MKKIAFVFLSFIVYSQIIGQIDTTGLSEEIKSKIIYLEITDTKSRSEIRNINTGQSKSTGNSRVITVYLKQGDKGEFKKLDNDGENLRVIIQDNRKAMTHFNKAFEIIKENRIYNMSEFVFQVGATLFLANSYRVIRKNKKLPEEEKNKNAVIGSFIGTGMCLTGFYICYFKCEKLLDQYKESIAHAVNFYNRDLIED